MSPRTVELPADLEQQLRDIHPTCDVRLCCPRHAILMAVLRRTVATCPQAATHVIRAWCGSCGNHGTNPLTCAEHAAVLQKLIDDRRLPPCPCGDPLNVQLVPL